MTVDTKKYGLGIMAHEFKHGFQFDNGELDLGENNERGILMDEQIESESNRRAKAFNTTTTSKSSGTPVPGTNKYTTASQMGKVYRRLGATERHAYRILNNTHIWKP